MLSQMAMHCFPFEPLAIATWFFLGVQTSVLVFDSLSSLNPSCKLFAHRWLSLFSVSLLSARFPGLFAHFCSRSLDFCCSSVFNEVDCVCCLSPRGQICLLRVARPISKLANIFLPHKLPNCCCCGMAAVCVIKANFHF